MIISKWSRLVSRIMGGLLAVLCSVCIFALPQAFAQEIETGESAPLNPAFINYMQTTRVFSASDVKGRQRAYSI